MHDLGHSKLESGSMMNEHVYGVPMQESYQGESPLDEILSQEAGMYETPVYGPGQEMSWESEGEYPASYEGESMYQQEMYGETGETTGETYESPLGMGAGQEFPGQQEFGIATEASSALGAVPTAAANEFNMEDEFALATELLEVQSDQELDQFLGKLVRGASKFMRSPAGKVLGGALKQIAKKALPIAGSALGTIVGGPVGGAVGGHLARAAGSALGLETAGMSDEEVNVASARQVVRLAANAARRAATTLAARPNANVRAVVRASLQQAARQHAPGLLGPQYGRIPVSRLLPVRGLRGTWVRRGRAIILYGV